MSKTRVMLCGLAAMTFSLALADGAAAQYRERSRPPEVETTPGERDAAPPDVQRRGREDQRRMRGRQREERAREKERRGERAEERTRRAAPADERRRVRPDEDRRRQAEPAERERRARPDRDRRRQAEPDDRRRRALPDRDRRREARPRERRRYERPAERRWHRDRPREARRVYIPRRWDHRPRPHRRHLWPRRYGRVWWCGHDCRILLLFGFTVWAVDTAMSYDSSLSFPVWEALEYNQTGETSLWESGWGYVEFTPTRTYRRRFGRYRRDCRDFLRVVVRNDGLERRYSGTACRNPEGVWWIVASRRVY
ncbi:MAG: hypothetical protein R3229_02240 [Alphaproteobacteria bacterium]|nr:hypothetical protein [Alphaproteobacteria bacterium]